MRSSRIRCAHRDWSRTDGVVPDADGKRRRALFDGATKKIFVESRSSGKSWRKSSDERSASSKLHHRTLARKAFLRLSFAGIEKLLKMSPVRSADAGSERRS